MYNKQIFGKKVALIKTGKKLNKTTISKGHSQCISVIWCPRTGSYPLSLLPPLPNGVRCKYRAFNMQDFEGHLTNLSIFTDALQMLRGEELCLLDTEHPRPCFRLQPFVTSSMVVLTQHSWGRDQRLRRNSRSSWLHNKLEASLDYDLKASKLPQSPRLCRGMELARESVQ